MLEETLNIHKIDGVEFHLMTEKRYHDTLNEVDYLNISLQHTEGELWKD